MLASCPHGARVYRPAASRAAPPRRRRGRLLRDVPRRVVARCVARRAAETSGRAVLSVHACRGEELPAVARFVREFPAIPAVALVSRYDRDASETLLRLGATGVRSAVDCSEPAGWRRLRDLVGHPASPVAARILARVVPALADATGDVRAFFEAIARLAPVLTTVRRLAA